MSRPYLGRTAFVGFGAESTWGTAVSATIYMGLISETMSAKPEKKQRPTLAEATGSANARGHYLGADVVGGTVVVECTYEGFLLLVKQAFGGTPTTTGPASSLYTHTCLLANTPQTGLTVRVTRGQGTTEVFAGCKVSKITFRIAAGDVGICTLELIGRSTDGRAGTDTASYTSSRDLFVDSYRQSGTVGWNSASYVPKFVEIELDNKLVRRQMLGDAKTLEPVPGESLMVTIKAQFEYFNDVLFTAFRADTQADLSFTLSGPTSYSLAFTIQNAYIVDYGDNVSSRGPNMVDVTWQGESDGTDEGIKIVAINSQSSAVAA